MFLNCDISCSQVSDARLLIQDKICNPGLSKEVNSPINMPISATYILSTSRYSNFMIYTNSGFEIPFFEALNNDDALTKMCMSVSELSLNEGWKNESDSHWESFIND